MFSVFFLQKLSKLSPQQSRSSKMCTVSVDAALCSVTEQRQRLSWNLARSDRAILPQICLLCIQTRSNAIELVFVNLGQGGNDLLGNRKQQGEQKLVLGNIALV